MNFEYLLIILQQKLKQNIHYLILRTVKFIVVNSCVHNTQIIFLVAEFFSDMF